MTKEDYNILINEIKSIKQVIKSTPKNELFTKEEAVKILKCSPRTLQTWKDKKMIDYVQIGNKIYFRQSDIEVFLQKHHIKSRL